MNKKKLFGYVMTGALSVGLLGGYGAQAFAATESSANSTAAVEQASNVKASLDSETKEKMQAIMDELKTNLAELGVDLPTKGGKGGHGDFLADLDDATKEKAQAILDQEREGTITKEEAQTQLADLGVEMPAKGDKGGHGDFLADLDDTTKEKAQALIDEAEAELTELGIDHLPFKGLGTQAEE